MELQQNELPSAADPLVGDPILLVAAGPNGAGKSTFTERALPANLEVVSDGLAASPHMPMRQPPLLMSAETILISQRRSFVAETVFSHASKTELVRQAARCGYLVAIHAILVPEDLAVARVLCRVENGGHGVPEEKVRSRFQRLWTHLAVANGVSAEAHLYDNSSARVPFRRIASFQNGKPTGGIRWPDWTPSALKSVAAQPTRSGSPGKQP